MFLVITGVFKIMSNNLENLLEELFPKNLQINEVNNMDLEDFTAKAETITDERLLKIQDDWVENGIKTPNEIFWFPTEELIKYREPFYKSREPSLKNKEPKRFDPKQPLQIVIGKNEIEIVGEGGIRLKTAIQLGIPYVPVKFYFRAVTKNKSF